MDEPGVRAGARSLPALLDVGADEVLRVLLQFVGDLCEDRVHVLVELFTTFLAGRRAAFGIVVTVATALALDLFLGHFRLPTHPAMVGLSEDYPATPTVGEPSPHGARWRYPNVRISHSAPGEGVHEFLGGVRGLQQG